MSIPKPTAEIRRTVLVELPLNGRPHRAVHCPDFEVLFEEVEREFPGTITMDGPHINGLIGITVEQNDRLDDTDAELIERGITAVHRALERSAP